MEELENQLGDSCERHIYNQSTCIWTVMAGDIWGQPGSQVGNVWFTLPNGSNPCNGPIDIAPGATVSIKYTTTSGCCQGGWYLTDNTNVVHPQDYGTNGLSIPGVVVNVGDTGGVNFNSPANGDITISLCTWGY